MLTPLTSLVLAAAGGGSSGFGGGGRSFGGGGGGGSFGGGGGYRGGHYVGPGGGMSAFAVGVIIVIIAILFGVSALATWRASRRYRAQRAERVRRVELASAEAAEDDAYFAADAVVREGTALFLAVQEAWDARDEDALAAMAGPDLLVEWRRRLRDFSSRGWHNRVLVRSGPRIEYVGLVNREDDSEDRVVLRIEAELDDWVVTGDGQEVFHEGRTSRLTALREYWTLARTPDGWILQSIEQQAEGDHQLSAEIVASPWGDETRIAAAATLEVAATDTPTAGFTTADLVDPDFAQDARAAALDLSLADARFGPDVIGACVSQAVAAWTEAIDGPDEALAACATPEAIRALLHPGDDAPDPRTRLVVRGAHVERIEVAELHPTPEPARITVAVTVTGRRYVEDRDTVAVVSGSRDRAVTFTERWTLALSGDAALPWRIVGAA